jgi:hypothetical protein
MPTFFPHATSPQNVLQYIDEAIGALGPKLAPDLVENVVLKNGLTVKVVIKGGKLITFYPVSGPGVSNLAEFAHKVI